MRLGRLEFYTYSYGNFRELRFTNYTRHEFYGKDKVFRWHFIALNTVFVLQLLKK